MSATLSMEDLEKFSDNIYEAIVVLAKRARQINDEQKIMIEANDAFEGQIDDYDEEEEDIEMNEKDQHKAIKFPKPTRLAIEEYLKGELEYDYGEEEESE